MATTKLLVQYGTGDCAEMLRLSGPRHKEYCDKHGYSFIQEFAAPVPPNLSAMWYKCLLLLRLFRTTSRSTRVLYLDADTLIEDVENDHLEALPDARDMAMVQMSFTNKKLGLQKAPWFNCGVWMLENSYASESLLKAVIKKGPVPGAPDFLQDEARLNEEINSGFPVSVFPLAPEYNAFACNANIPNVKIRGWHGTPRDTVRKRMKERLWQLSPQSV